MKKLFSVLMLAAALPFLGGCSSDDDEQKPMVGPWPAIETISQEPQWQVTPTPPKNSIQGKADWQWDDQMFRNFSKDMTAILALNDDGVKLSSPEDRMAAVVGGQVRFIAEPVFEEQIILGEVERFVTFYLYVPFETGEDAVDIQYYNARLDRTIIQRNMFSVNDDVVGNEEFKMFYLYPKTNYLYTLAPGQPFTSSMADKMAFFADDVCCGIAHPFDLTDEISWAGAVYDEMHDGKVYVRYYSAAQKTIYTTQTTLSGIYLDEILLDFRTK